MNARELAWGLQRLRYLLPEDTREAFLTLECELLDILHRQKIARLSERLASQQMALFDRCDQFARTCGVSRFADLCVAEPSPLMPISTTNREARPDAHTILPNRSNTVYDLYKMVDIQLLTDYVPAAYCFQKKAQGKEFPLVRVTFDTTKLKLPCVATITVAFASYGESVSKTLPLEPDKPASDVFLPTLTAADLEHLHECCLASLDIKVGLLTDQVVTEHQAIPLRHETMDVYLYPRNVAILWLKQRDGTVFNCTNGLAAWVTPRLYEIEKLHSRATQCHPDGELPGYPTKGTKKARKLAVRVQVRALFQTLYEGVQLAYATSSNVVRPKADQTRYVLQNVRLPVDIFNADGPANCLDGSLLFASLLEKANLHPALLLYQGHAIVGWRVFPDEQRYDFLEATSINSGDFELACQQGWKFYRRAYPGGTGAAPGSATLLGPRLIDILVCRQRDIVSMHW
jgi:hypothetical protein